MWEQYSLRSFMRLFRFLLVIAFFSSCFYLQSLERIAPQDQILILEDFITPKEAETLIGFYNRTKTDLVSHLDNQLPIPSISNRLIQQILFNISNRVLELIEQSYPSSGKRYYLDHGGIYSRIKGNFCPYHADNIRFECPIHGKDQSVLRLVCDGECPGSKFVPNHTPWREYTALVYLNDNFKGGEILFEDGPCNKLYQKVIPIKANMMILAPNGRNFYHEVFPIRQGTRYSIHLWYTSDSRHRFVFRNG